MKIYIAIFYCLLFFSCHSSNDTEIAQDKVEDYLTRIQKTEDYEPILYGELDSSFTSVKETELYKEYDQRRRAFEALEILKRQHPDMFSDEESKSNIEKGKYYQVICDSLESVFAAEFNGWKIQHIYKLRNDKNELVVDNYIFFLDKDLQTVIKKEQVYRNLPFKTYSQNTNFYGIKNKQ